MMRDLPFGADHCLQVFLRAARPRNAMTVSEWADAHRELSGKQSGERGRWRTSRTPFLREIMDCFSASSRVAEVWVMKSSQVGITEAIVNVLGYFMEHFPGPVMVMMPSLESRDGWKVQKLNPLLLETPVIRDLLGGARSRDAANRQDMIDYPGGVLFLSGGNSANSYAQKSARTIILDDLDRFPDEVGDEGDIITLAEGRTKAFPRGKRCYVSTPTVKGRSKIQSGWERSDKRRYHVSCPHCDERQPLVWSQLKYSEAMKKAWYVCRGCGAEIYEHQKPAMLAAGQWIAEYPERSVRGYHINALYAPIGLGPSWWDLAQKWIDVQGRPAALRAFINTNLGEPCDDEGEAIEAIGLISRLEEYPDQVPGRFRSVGIDVQKNRVEVTVIDWDIGEQAWVRDHLIVPGDTADPQVWDDLGAELDDISPDGGCIDEGYNTTMVRAFAAKRRWLRTTKGMHGPGYPLVEDERKRKQRLRRRRKSGHSPEPIGVDQGKALLMARVKLQRPGPGYIHWPATPAFDTEYFDQLGAEKLKTQTRGGKTVSIWVQIRPRNEALDCYILALAGLRLAGVDLSTMPLRSPDLSSFSGEASKQFSIEEMIAAAKQEVTGGRTV